MNSADLFVFIVFDATGIFMRSTTFVQCKHLMVLDVVLTAVSGTSWLRWACMFPLMALMMLLQYDSWQDGCDCYGN